MRSFRLLTCAVLIALATTLAPGAADAQAASRAVIARIYEVSPSTRSYVAAFPPADSQTAPAVKVSKLADVQPDLNANASPDGKWIAVYGYNGTTRTEQFTYGLVGQTQYVSLDVKGYNVLWTRFSSDSRLLMYTLGVQEGRWKLGLLDLASGKKFDFAGEFSYRTGEKAGLGFDGVANALHLSADRKRLIVNAYVPYTGGNFGGIYAFNLPELNFNLPAPAPFPKATQILKGGQVVSDLALSPDGTQLAYLYDDSANPPQNYRAIGPASTTNTLALFDFSTGQSRVLAKAGPGQGLEAIAWLPDGKTILFTGGNYRESYYVVQPNAYTVDVAQARVTEGAKLEEDPQTMIESILVCGDTLFISTGKDNSDGNRISTLYSAPLADLKARRALGAGSYIVLLTCKTA